MNTNSPYGPNLVINSGLTNFRSTLEDIRKLNNTKNIPDLVPGTFVTIKFEHQYYTGPEKTKGQLRVSYETPITSSKVLTSSTTFDHTEHAFLAGYDTDWLDTVIADAVKDTKFVTEQYISERATGAHISDEMLVGWFDDMFAARMSEVGIDEGIIATAAFVDLEIISVSVTIV